MRWRRRNRGEDLERELRGHLELEAETAGWRRLAEAIGLILGMAEGGRE